MPNRTVCDEVLCQQEKTPNAAAHSNFNYPKWFFETLLLEKEAGKFWVQKFHETMQVLHKISGKHSSFLLLHFSSSQQIKKYEKSFKERNSIFQPLSAFLNFFHCFSSFFMKISLKLAQVINWRNNESPVSSRITFGTSQEDLHGIWSQNELAELFFDVYNISVDFYSFVPVTFENNPKTRKVYLRSSWFVAFLWVATRKISIKN